jgi:hypothetical protein
MAVILTIVKPWIDKGTIFSKGVFFIIVCEFLEIIVSLSDLPDIVYRMLAIRYIFLIYLGYLWVKRGIEINYKNLTLSLFSMGAIVYFAYYYVPTEPWFYNTVWRTHRWPCYYYVSFFLCSVLYYIFVKVYKINSAFKVIKILAKCSYEIFLLQMVLIAFLDGCIYLNSYVELVIIWVISIVGGYYFNKVYSKLLKKCLISIDKKIVWKRTQ